MFLNYINWNVKPQIVDFGNFELRWYSLLFATGFIIGYYILARMFKHEGVSSQVLDKLTVYVVISTIIGARLGHCLFYEPEIYLKHPLKIFLPFEGTPGKDFHFTGFQGLASHGGAIGILIGLYIFHRKVKVSYIWILDRMAVVTALAGVFIRIGNLFNSEIYGRPTNLPWGFRFMREALYEPQKAIVPKHPTQIYEALSYLAIFIFLLVFYRKKERKPSPGMLTGFFLLLVFTARFFIEFIKENQVNFEDNLVLNMGQWLSIPFVITGGILIYLSSKKKLGKA
jgi:phosphatidylglycerol---prolipoprotein diacylglyceryl transferase